MTDSNNTTISFDGARVLVAEDSKINQQIAVEHLEEAGAKPSIANNGQEAVEQLKNSPFDAVFMDLQMPVMDGFEATRIIREIPEFDSLPIIAMTAAGAGSDKDTCLKAGMTDYCIKSLDPADLYAALARCIPSRIIDKTQNSHNTHQLPDIPGMDFSIARKNLSGSETLIASLLIDFRREHANDHRKILEAIQDGNIDEARRVAHSMVSIAGSLGASGLSATSKSLEEAFIHKADSIYDLLLNEFKKELDEIIDALSSINLDAFLKTNHVDLDINEVIESVKHIQQLIEDMSPDSLDEAISIQQSLNDTSLSLYADNLVTLLTDFNFDEAKNALADLGKSLHSMSED